MQKRSWWFPVALVSMTIGAASCGGGTEATTVPDEAAAPQTDATIIEISATEFAFGPADLLVKRGETVTLRLRNDGAQIHNIEMPDLRVFVEAVPGVTKEVTFTVPAGKGTISFWCNVAGHRESGMEGTVIIS